MKKHIIAIGGGGFGIDNVNNPSSGEGIENISAKFNSEDLSISFNSRYLTDIASQIENENWVYRLRKCRRETYS